MANPTKECGQGAKSADRFLARMESQCFQIERYRWEIRRTEGRILSEDEAAREWIERYAAAFAREFTLDEDC